MRPVPRIKKKQSVPSPVQLPVSPTTEQPVIAKEILDLAKLALEPEQSMRPAKCVVCSSDCAPNSSEGLCWICRRLKISAWRDSDTQMGAQE